MAKRYTAQYRTFAARHGMTCEQLGPFWSQARHIADAKFPEGDYNDGYWPYVWATMTGLVERA